MTSRTSANSSSGILGESWATWVPEDVDQDLDGDNDDDKESLLDSDLRSCSFTGAIIDSRPMENSPLSESSHMGPELIMPSIHEGVDEHGSWVLPHASVPDDNSPFSRATMSFEKRTEQQSKSPPPGVPRKTRIYPKYSFIKRLTIKRTLGHVLVGIGLGIACFIMYNIFLRSRTPRSQQILATSVDENTTFPDNSYENMAESSPEYDTETFYSEISKLANNAQRETHHISEFFKDSEVAANDLCGILFREYVGSKYEIEFECQTISLTIRRAKEEFVLLTGRSGSFLTEELAFRINQFRETFENERHPPKHQTAFQRFLNKYISSATRANDSDGILAQRRDRYRHQIEQIVSSQRQRTSTVSSNLEQFEIGLQSIGQILLLAEAHPAANNGYSEPIDNTKSFFGLVKTLGSLISQKPLKPRGRVVGSLPAKSKQKILHTIDKTLKRQSLALDALHEYSDYLSLFPALSSQPFPKTGQ